MIITEITPLEKGRARVSFDCAEPLILYKGELRKLGLEEHETVSDSLYAQIFCNIVGKRAKKRAMHLLEKTDRTEAQLRGKLEEGQYPQQLIEQAVAYVKSYRYIDDDRYARTFVRLNQDKKSIGRIKADLLYRGVAKGIIARAIAEETEMPQEALIAKLLEKKRYDRENATPQEMRRMYQFLLRRGFRTEEIMHVLHGASTMPYI